MRQLIPLIILLLIYPMVYGACDGGEISYRVPAVLGQDGGLVNVTIKLLSGNGNVYLNTYPTTGVSTQYSAQTAVRYAFYKAEQNIKNCDVLISIHGENVAGYVDGPSAGLALAAVTYSQITERDIREDAIITGGIGSSGEATRVGGLYEKAKAVSRNGADYFVTPPQTLSERILLNQIKRAYNITIIEISNADEAIDFLVNGVTPPTIPLISEKPNLPEVPEYTLHPQSEVFYVIAQRMINAEKESVEMIEPKDEDVKIIKQQFERNIERQNFILNKGYLFTAANEAFLGYIDASTVAAADSFSDIKSIQNKKNEISACLADLKSDIPKTSDNFELLVGADLRTQWAKQRLATTGFNETNLIEERYYKFNQLMYADAWCKVTASLIEQAPGNTGGRKINETELAQLTSKKIRQLTTLNTSNGDYWLAEKAESAKKLAENGKYAASIFDSTYVISMNEAQNNLINSTPEKISADIDTLSRENYASFWANVYQAHGVFMAKDRNSMQNDAYRILYYAKKLEQANSEINELLSQQNGKIVEETKPEKFNLENILDITILYVSVFLFIIILLLSMINSYIGRQK